jgi:hypothetical protein
MGWDNRKTNILEKEELGNNICKGIEREDDIWWIGCWLRLKWHVYDGCKLLSKLG